jgi:hypothetical protein
MGATRRLLLRLPNIVSVRERMSQIYQNLDVSRHELVYIYI